MNEDLGFILIFVFCIAAIVALRLLARMDNTIGHIFKWWWNINFKIAAHIPFTGWMAHFIITDDSETAKREKAHYIEVGEKADKAGYDYVQAKATAPAMGKIYYGRHDGERYEVISTYNHSALLSNCMTGAHVDVTVHGSEGNLADAAGNLYTPDA